MSTVPTASAADAPLTATWVPVASAIDRPDREQLRSLLGWRYEAHARAVSGVLALQPGMRAAGGSDDLLGGLIAVRAQLSTFGDRVDRLLRGEAEVAGSAQANGAEDIDLPGAELLARCSNSGLRRLPAVVGPVFRPGLSDPALLERYRTGSHIVEPAFTEARLKRYLPVGSTVEYAIWSTTARRTDRLLGADPGNDPSSPRVLFRAGVRFQVLAVDTSDEVGVPPRVLLREVSAASTDAEVDERTRDRLRESITRSAVPSRVVKVMPQWRLAIGIRNDAAVFAPVDAQKELSA